MRIAATPIELNPATRNDPVRIDQVARQLEGQFAQMLIKSMRDASFGDSLFPGENTMFREMYDQKIAEAMTRGKGLGLSAIIARQLGGGGAAETPALDTSLAKPAEAARAYQLASPATLPASLPGRDADEADALARLPSDAQARVLQPMERALDLIAGRESSAMHAAQGRNEPYSMPAASSPAQENWAMADDRWQDLDALARQRGRAPGSVDSMAAGTAARQLGAHTPEGFVASIWPHAQQAARELGVNPRALVAQAALETGWGRKLIQRDGGGSAHNLFGIKASGWKGERATTGTHEYVNGVRHNQTASFRAYASPAESFADYVRLLKTNTRYQPALQAGGDVRGFAQGLQKAGYATDPSYAAKIAAIANGPTIDRAVAAIGDAGARLGSRFASNASPTGLGMIRR